MIKTNIMFHFIIPPLKSITNLYMQKISLKKQTQLYIRQKELIFF